MGTNEKKKTEDGLNAAGFTLIELMLVVAIIAIIAAIAIPSFMRSRVLANEAATIGNLRVISQAENTFNTARGTFGNFAELTAAVPQFLGGAWVDGVARRGYIYTITNITQSNFICYADPETPNNTGVNYYRVDATGQIRRNPSGHPSDTDEVVGN